MKTMWWTTLCALWAIVLLGGNAYAQSEPKSADWLSGEWTGIRQEAFRVQTTLRLAYEPATNKIRGDGDLVNLDKPGVGAKVIVEGHATKDTMAKKDKVTLTMKHIGGLADGRTFTFELERRDDGSLYGSTSGGMATLTLTRK